MAQANSLDDQVLGAGTTLRFVLLLMLFAAASAAMTGNVVTLVTDPGNSGTGCLLADGVNPAGGLWSGLAALDYGNNTALSRCFAQHVPNVSWVPAATTAALLLAAYGLYRSLPALRCWRHRLVQLGEVDEPGIVRERVDDLADVAGVRSRQISIFADPTAATSGALAFGTRGRPALCLNAGLIVAARTDTDRFRAVVLHELAHIRNGDVGLTYATVALWRVFLGLVLLPQVAVLIYEAVTNTAPAQWDNTGSYANQLLEIVLIILLVYLARADILRDREIYADLAAARWGAGSEAWTAPAQTADGRLRVWMMAAGNLLSAHPSWAVRSRSLTDPAAVFALSPLPMLLTGAAADILSIQLLFSGTSVTLTEQEVLALLVAGIITAIVGTAVWRAAAYAALTDRPAPTGWSAGLWLGVGLALGELTDLQVTDGRAFPSQPEALAVLIAVCVLLTVWMAQSAELWIRTWQGASLRPAMAAGLVVPWLVLAFVLYWWYSDGSALANGWIYSTSGVLHELAVGGISLPAHPGPLLTFGALILLLPGSDTTFLGLWWVLPLLWLVPLLLFAARAPRRLPRWLARAVTGATDPAPLQVEVPRLRAFLLPGLAGGLAGCAGMLCVRAAFHTVQGLAFLHDGSVPEFGFATWQIIVPSAAAILTAAVVAVLGERHYYLLRALVAAGIAALLSFGAEYLLGAVDGCLGPLNVQTPVCLWLPTAPWPEDEAELGLVFGLAMILSGVAALLAASMRRRTVVPGRHALRVLRQGNRGLVFRRVAIAVIGVAAAGLTIVDTVQSTADSSAPALSFTAARQIEKSPATVQEMPETVRLQMQAWLGFGGHGLLAESDSAVSAFSNAVNDMVRAGPRRDVSVLEKEVPPTCEGFFRLVRNADGYFAVPVGAGQQLWAEALGDLHTAADGCQKLVRNPTDATLDDEVADIKKAAGAVTVFAHWVQHADPRPSRG